MAVRAFEALGCEGLSRVDFFYTPTGGLIAQRDQHDAGLHRDVGGAAAVGRHRASYAELVDRLIQLALDRSPGPALTLRRRSRVGAAEMGRLPMGARGRPARSAGVLAGDRHLDVGRPGRSR